LFFFNILTIELFNHNIYNNILLVFGKKMLCKHNDSSCKNLAFLLDI